MTKIDKKWAAGIKDGVNALIMEVERLEVLGERYEKALEKVATCKDDGHSVLQLLGQIANDALAGKDPA